MNTPRRAILSRLARTFVRSAILSVSLHAVVGCATLALGAYFATRSHTFAVTSLSVIVGFFGGALSGMLTAIARTVRGFEQECRGWLQRSLKTGENDPTAGLRPDGLPVRELRERVEQAGKRFLDSTVRRFPLPHFMTRLIESQLRRAIVEDFIAHCEQRNLTTVGFGEFSAWLLLKGLALATAPISIRLWIGRILVWTILTMWIVGLWAIR